MVRLYTLPDGNNVITLEEKTDIEQSVDLQELFGTNKKSSAESEKSAANSATEQLKEQ